MVAGFGVSPLQELIPRRGEDRATRDEELRGQPRGPTTEHLRWTTPGWDAARCSGAAPQDHR